MIMFHILMIIILCLFFLVTFIYSDVDKESVEVGSLPVRSNPVNMPIHPQLLIESGSASEYFVILYPFSCFIYLFFNTWFSLNYFLLTIVRGSVIQTVKQCCVFCNTINIYNKAFCYLWLLIFYPLVTVDIFPEYFLLDFFYNNVFICENSFSFI